MSKHFEALVTQYRLAGNPWPARSITIAAWAMNKGLWKQPPTAALRQCARAISRSLREEYYTDARGRRVRVKHPVTRSTGPSRERFGTTSAQRRGHTWICRFGRGGRESSETADNCTLMLRATTTRTPNSRVSRSYSTS